MTSQLQEYRTIPLNNGAVTLVDAIDYAALSVFSWRCDKARMPHGYAVLRGKYHSRQNRMHNIIMKPPDGMEVDHINGNGLDNRRENLRLATRSQQDMNRVRGNKRKGTSRFRGVRWWKTGSKWQARIKLNQREIHLGFFSDETEAARAYDVAARKLFGDFARPNGV
jgi:hypothetical protein